MPTLYSPSKKYFNRNDSSFHGGPRRASFSSSKKKLSLLGPFGSLSLSLSSAEPLAGHSFPLFLSLSRLLCPSLPPVSLSIFTGFRGISTERFSLLSSTAAPCPRLVLLARILCERIHAGFRGISPSTFLLSHNFFFQTSPNALSLLSLSLPDSLSLIFNGLAHRPPFCFLASIAIELLQEIDPTSSSSLSRELWRTLFLLASFLRFFPLFFSSRFFSLLFIY